jgi:hypothetical protein
MIVLLAPIPEAPGYFAEFATGAIWSTKGKIPKRLAGGLSRGYRIYSLLVGGRQITRFGHRLVATAAYGPCPSGHECCHRNGVRTDNAAENLRWATPSENNGADKLAAGRLLYGESHQNSKLTRAQVDAMRSERAASGTSYAKLGNAVGVSEQTAFRICTGKAWKK